MTVTSSTLSVPPSRRSHDDCTDVQSSCENV